MSLERAIETLLEAIVAAPAADDDSLAASLKPHGLSGDLAERLVAFVPIAFGRAILEERGARFPDGYEVRDLDAGKSQHGRLVDEAVYVAALQYVQRAGTQDERVRSVAQRSAEMDVANKLLRPGTSARGLVFTEPVFLRLPLTAQS